MAIKSVDIDLKVKTSTSIHKNADKNSEIVTFYTKGIKCYADKESTTAEMYRLYKLKSGGKVEKEKDHVKIGWAPISSFTKIKTYTPMRADVVKYENSKKKDVTEIIVGGIANSEEIGIKKPEPTANSGKEYESLNKAKDDSLKNYQKKYKITKAQKADYDKLIKYNAPISDWKSNTANRIVRGVINAEKTIKYSSNKKGINDKDVKEGKTENWTNTRYVNLIRSIESNGLIFGPNDARDKYFNKFARINFIDPYFTTTNGTKEYLFFVKPDLNIVRVNQSYHGRVVSYLATDSFFVDLAKNHPDTVIGLQYSYTFLPFCNMLSACCVQNLDIPNIDADTMDTPKNVYGTSIEYRQDGSKSDENITFNLEFRETKNRDVYYYFKAYEEYEKKKKLGLVRPKYQRYITDKILHDQMGIYKIIVGEDMHTIVFASYLCGVMPMDVPRGAYSEPDPNTILKYSIGFKSAFIEDTRPIIFRDFNILQNKHKEHYDANRVIEPYDVDQMQINGEWGYACNVKQVSTKFGDRFVLEWYGVK